jgi:hypothetical protein
MADIISPKLTDLAAEFEALQRHTKEKGERLFDAKRADLYEQSCDDIDGFVMDLERQIETEPVGNDLTSVNILMQKQQMIETQMQIKSAQVPVSSNEFLTAGGYNKLECLFPESFFKRVRLAFNRVEHLTVLNAVAMP